MSNKVITMHQVRSIIQYLSKGYSLRAISRELRISRKTITEYSIRLKNHGVALTQLQQLSDSELAAIVYAASKPVIEDERQKDFKERTAYFLSELKRTGVTRQLLWQEYRAGYADGYGYTCFCILLAEYANKATHRPTDISIYDRYSGERVIVDPKYLRHEQTENIVWQLHMGQWWGWLGKLSTFLAGIVATSLPITGFLIWWGRRRKRPAKSLTGSGSVSRSQ